MLSDFFSNIYFKKEDKAESYDMTHLLDEVQMKALACVIRMHDEVSTRKVKEALTLLTQELDLDDVGYFYNPQNPDLLCTVPGMLHGVMANAPLIYFPLNSGCYKAVEVLKQLDNDYKKLLIIIADRTSAADDCCLKQISQDTAYQVKVFIGKSFNSEAHDFFCPGWSISGDNKLT